MGLISETVIIKWHGRNKQYYIEKGYLFTKIGNGFEVKVSDLQKATRTHVNCKCDNCGKILENVPWQNYLEYVKEDNRYFCNDCANKLYVKKSAMKTLLKNGTSFEKWCIQNDRIDILNRWSLKNNCDPDEVLYASSNNIFFDCPRGIHEPELKKLSAFTKGQEGSIKCNKCNSLGQHIIDNFGDDFLTKLWSDRNNKSPFEYSYASNEKVWWKCPNNKHTDFERVICDSSLNCEFRCPNCSCPKGEDAVEKFLINNNITYEQQTMYEKLSGIGGGKLSFDFFLPEHNLLIEYQGEQHGKPIDFGGRGFEFAEKQFKTQQENDNLKREYAKQNNIKLLEIWYYDFDRIDEILLNELNLYAVHQN